jgi:hypothetical protein
MGKTGVSTAAIAAGVIAAAGAAAAGYYFYGSKDAQKHRKAAVAWAGDMRKEIQKEAKRLRSLDMTVMHDVIDRVSGAYEEARKVDPAEIRKAAEELKQNWKKLRGEVAGRAKKAAPKRATAKKRR